eukprot:jgi/Botrbrau1/3468/Bobra.139_1s0043.1
MCLRSNEMDSPRSSCDTSNAFEELLEQALQDTDRDSAESSELVKIGEEETERPAKRSKIGNQHMSVGNSDDVESGRERSGRASRAVGDGGEIESAENLPSGKISGKPAGRSSAKGRADTCPPHPGYLQGVCIRCGKVVPQEASDTVALRYIHAGLELSTDEAERIRSEGLKSVLEERKLLLVLDLDHTLLNSTRFQDLSPSHHEKLCQILRLEQDKQQKKGPKTLHHLPHMCMWTKLRPGVDDFLSEASQLFELHIYTHGDASYAAEMAKLLDPDRRYFAQRIMSQSDSTKQTVKNLDIVLGAEQAVVVLDDTSAVWPAHQRNLITAERYVFFPGLRAALLQRRRVAVGHEAGRERGRGDAGLRARGFEAGAR